MENEKDCNVYVMLTKTETAVSKFINKHTNCKYTHAAFSLNKELTDMYSFARRRPKNFLISGFIKEDLHGYIYSLNPNAPCVVYRYRVSKDTKDKARKIIDGFMSNYKKHKYNMVGLVAIKHDKVLKRKYKYACSQFVAHVLIESRAIEKLDKSIWLIAPDDLQNVGGEVIYDGKLKDVENYMKEYQE